MAAPAASRRRRMTGPPRSADPIGPWVYQVAGPAALDRPILALVLTNRASPVGGAPVACRSPQQRARAQVGPNRARQTSWPAGVTSATHRTSFGSTGSSPVQRPSRSLTARQGTDVTVTRAELTRILTEDGRTRGPPARNGDDERVGVESSETERPTR